LVGGWQGDRAEHLRLQQIGNPDRAVLVQIRASGTFILWPAGNTNFAHPQVVRSAAPTTRTD
jgi:hypothetical protein